MGFFFMTGYLIHGMKNKRNRRERKDRTGECREGKGNGRHEPKKIKHWKKIEQFISYLYHYLKTSQEHGIDSKEEYNILYSIKHTFSFTH